MAKKDEKRYPRGTDILGHKITTRMFLAWSSGTCFWFQKHPTKLMLQFCLVWAVFVGLKIPSTILSVVRQNASTIHLPVMFSHSKTNSPLWHQVRDVPISHSFKNAQNMGNRARKCIWHCFSCEMAYRSTRLRSFTRLKARERFLRLVLR